MHLVKETAGAVCILHVEEDRIDAAVAIQFKESFRALIDGEARIIVLNLGKVTFLDSSGLGAVVASHKMLGPERVLELAALQPAVDKVMTLTRMNTVFPIHASIDHALRVHDVQHLSDQG